MQIVHESLDALILKERATVLRAIGAVLGIAGIAMIGVSVVSQGLTPAALLIVGAVMITLGALFGLLPATHTFAFSRRERRLVIVRQRPGRTTREEHALRDVAEAFVDTSGSSDGDTYRVAVRLADGRVIPVTSYYSSGYASKKAAADRMQLFIDQAGYRAEAAVEPRVEPVVVEQRLTNRRPKLLATTFLAVFGLLFGGIGGTIMWREQQRLTTWLPVEATVLSKSVDRHSDDDGTTYSPVVVYSYRVNGRSFRSDRVLPISESRSGRWADHIIENYDVNQKYTAWYNPADPSQAFLRRSRSIVAAVFTGVGVLLIVIAVVVRQRSASSA